MLLPTEQGAELQKIQGLFQRVLAPELDSLQARSDKPRSGAAEPGGRRCEHPLRRDTVPPPERDAYSAMTVARGAARFVLEAIRKRKPEEAVKKADAEHREVRRQTDPARS
jgi:hypothetical protein